MPHTVIHLNLDLESLDRTKRSPPILNKLGPSVRKHKVLNTSFSSIKDRSIEVHRNITPVLNAVLNRPRHLTGHSLSRVDRSRGREIKSEFIKGTSRIAVAFLAVQKTCRFLKNVFELPQLLVRDVDGELGMTDADKLSIDVQRAVEAFADDVTLVLFLQCTAVLDALW